MIAPQTLSGCKLNDLITLTSRHRPLFDPYQTTPARRGIAICGGVQKP